MDTTTTESKTLLLIHDALVCYLDQPESKRYFHNGDKGHAFFRADSDGKTMRKKSYYQGGPEVNELYLFGQQIYDELIDRNEIEMIQYHEIGRAHV